jgi:streptogramin lyase
MSSEGSTGGSRSAPSVAILVALIVLSSSDYSPTVSIASGSVSPNQITPIQKFTLTEWGVPTVGGGPLGIGLDPAGKIWVTENSTSKIARFDPANNMFTEWNIPTPSSQPRSIFVKQVTISGANVTQVFFTEYASNKIACFDPSNNNFTEWQLATGSNPVGIYVDEKTDIWFTESGRDIIGRLTPSTNNLTEWTLPDATSKSGSPALKPWGIYVRVVPATFGGSNRFVWFTESANNKIGRLEANSNRLTLWDLSSLGLGSYQPSEITFGLVDTVPVAVFANVNSNRISILGNDTGGGSLYRESLIVTNPAKPAGVTFDSSRNAIWFVENSAGNIANLNTTTIFQGWLLSPAYCTIAPATGSPPCTSPATKAFSIVGAIANAGVSGSSLIQNPALTSTIDIYKGPLNGVTEYRLPNVASRPTSLSLDSGGNLWFTESNLTVNRIGRLSVPYVFQVSASPSTQTVNQGQNATYAVNVALLSGSPLPLTLTLLNAPSGVSTQFNPQTANPPFASTLTVATTNSTPTGTFLMSVQASSGGQRQSSAVTLEVQPPPPPVFDYTISVTSTKTVTIPQGRSASFGVTVSLTNGSPQSVRLTATGLPTGANYFFTVASGLPTFTSTFNVQSDVNTPAGSYPITITGVSSGGSPHQPAQGPVLVITELPRDFSLTTPVSQVILVQASRTDITLTVTSIGVFSGNVTFSGAFSPSVPGLTVTFSPSSVMPEPNGGTDQTVMEIAAKMNIVGTYVLRVNGTSETPSRTHQIMLKVGISPCVIATATFGSELAREVQFLRSFRDQQIMNTFAGSNFMVAFNAWYYSFSPAIAQYEYSHATVRTMIKVALYPLIGVLHLASSTYAVARFQPELAALAAGLLASSLIGLVYLALPMSATLWLRRKNIDARTKRRVARWIAATIATLIAGFIISEIFALPVVMMFVSVGLVLTALGAGTILPALEAVEHFRSKA